MWASGLVWSGIARFKNFVFVFGRVGSFTTPRLSMCTEASRIRLLECCRPRPKVFVTRDPGMVRQTLGTKCRPVSFLIRRGSLRKRTRRVLGRCPSIPICAIRCRLLIGLAKFTLAHKVLYSVHEGPLPSMRRVYEGTDHVTILRGIMGPAGVKTVFHSTTTLRVSTMLLANKYDSPLCQQTTEMDVKAMFRVP